MSTEQLDTTVSQLLDNYNHFLEGYRFTVCSDHKPLTFAIQTQTSSHAPCIAQQMVFVLRFTDNIGCMPGGDNVVVNTLSWAFVASVTPPPQHTSVDIDVFVAAQEDVEILLALCLGPSSILKVC